jgi:hypothetical protein
MATKFTDVMKEALSKKQNHLPGKKNSNQNKVQVKNQTTLNKPIKRVAGRGG